MTIQDNRPEKERELLAAYRNMDPAEKRAFQDVATRLQPENGWRPTESEAKAWFFERATKYRAAGEGRAEQ